MKLTVIFLQEGDKTKMTETFEQKLEQKRKESTYLSLSDLADTLKAVIIKEPQFKADKRANEAMFMELRTSTYENKLFVQKFGKSTYELLSIRIKACGGLKPLMETEHTWTKEKAGRATFNRYFPVPNKETKK
jgi:hypothetical protein